MQLKGFKFLFFLSQLDNLQQMVVGVMSEDRDLQLEATAGFRRLLSIGL